MDTKVSTIEVPETVTITMSKEDAAKVAFILAATHCASPLVAYSVGAALCTAVGRQHASYTLCGRKGRFVWQDDGPNDSYIPLY